MAALASLSDLLNRATGGNSGTPENLWIWRTGRIAGTAITAPVAGRMNSMWRWDGQPNPGGAIPAAAAVPTRATAGAWTHVNPGGARQKWLYGGGFWGLAGGQVLLYDRLLHNGGLSGIVTTAQTVGGTLTRNTGGVGNMIAVEVYTAIGGTATTVTASYTNQAGTAGRTTRAVAIGGTGLNEAGRMILLPLADGDTGVQAVASVTLAATTGTAGSFGVTIVDPLAPFAMPAIGLGSWKSLIDGFATPEILTDACLNGIWVANTVTVPEVYGTLAMVEA